ncbi:uncharacterized protein LOC129218227 [Uloborus diversus]|uniref:uncharacterized protein LOC129218227 n=1 Tax=Uloborus diversus TaxID=327109 RepID=UPI00240A828B|nr:uncharacterized protein LOC129218227 [Uloborus diversus]
MAKKLQVAQAKFKLHLKEVGRFESMLNDFIAKPNTDILLYENLLSELEDTEDILNNVILEVMVNETDEETDDYENFSKAKKSIHSIKSQIQRILSDLKPTEESASRTVSQTVEPKPNLKLPKFNLPTFDGDIQNWISFKQVFTSAIGSNKALTNCQKLQYLNAAVSGNAHRLIKGFPVVEANYAQAWETLSNRYDNKRELAYSLCTKIFNIKLGKMSSKFLHEMIDCCNESVRNLNTLGLKLNKLSEIILIHFLQKRLDENIRRQWELTLESDEFPSYQKFMQFLELNARSLHSSKDYAKEEKSKAQTLTYTNTTSNKAAFAKAINCTYCNSNHTIFRCPKFLGLNFRDRLEFVKKRKLCFNCLRENHDVYNCKVTMHCRVCSRKHHTLLHCQSNKSSTHETELNSKKENSNSDLSQTVQHDSNAVSLSGTNNSEKTLLTTAMIKVKDVMGGYQDCRALIDCGSQNSLISEDCFQQLGLNSATCNCTIKGIGNSITSQSSKMVKLEFTPYFNSNKFFMDALVVKNLTIDLPNCNMTNVNWPHLKNLKLADPQFHISRPVDIIIGADVFLDLIEGEQIKNKHNAPGALDSKLGWLLMGKVSSYSPKSKSYTFHHDVNQELDLTLQKFWELDSIPNEDKDNLNSEEITCEQFYENTTKRAISGKYTVKLPFKREIDLGESRTKAVSRFLSQEKKFEKDKILAERYKGFMQEYIALNHMELVPENEKLNSKSFYMPHHGVIREQSTTTKLRVVFDASAKSSENISLNDILHKGPKLQLDLSFILMNFRTHSIALAADIEKMFRMITVSKEDCDFQRIIWRTDSTSEIKDYRLLTVTYGTACAPYLAVKTIQQLAADEQSLFPKAAEIVKTDFYMDDLLTGADSTSEARNIVLEMNELMKKGGFTLRKWLSNDPKVIEFLPEDLKATIYPKELGEEHSIKVLGIEWDPITDYFRIQIKPPSEVKNKRQLLSNIAKIYDPLGFLAPTTLLAKLLIQELWSEKIGWDENLPEQIMSKWQKFASELMHLKEIKIPRSLKDKCSISKSVEIHAFCDASQKAYSAVIYLRFRLENGEIKVSFLVAKTRVAPLRKITLPRLELCSAVLLSRLYKSIKNRLLIVTDFDYFYTDSQIVLDWIKSESRRWKVFVANRVSEIQKLTPVENWFHVRSEDNPGDCASRGILPSKLKEHQLWWKGPVWLSDPNFSINSSAFFHPVKESDQEQEESESVLGCLKVESSPFIQNYSSYVKLIRITAWCLRFIKNCKTTAEKRKFGFLTSEEKSEAISRVIKIVQNEEFKLEIPMHAGVQTTLFLIREIFWIISGRNAVRNIIRKCIVCLKANSLNSKQLMGNLPKERVIPARAFSKCGLDFAGPVITKPNLKRSKVTLKSYIALFVCFTTKAIHLEVVSDLSTGAFLACLRRFIGRRGKPSDIFSDNATNFKGARNYLNAQAIICSSEDVQNYATEENINWHFIPPITPHFGGLWESNIKTVKKHLIKASNSAILNFEELSTLLIQIEACLNSRPLTPLSADPMDLQPLTPGHFLIGAPLLSFPEQYSAETNSAFSCRWKVVQCIRNRFWNRWSQEFLTDAREMQVA